MEVFKCLKFNVKEFGSVRMCRGIRACAYEFVAMVTEGVVHGVCKVVFQCNMAT